MGIFPAQMSQALANGRPQTAGRQRGPNNQVDRGIVGRLANRQIHLRPSGLFQCHMPHIADDADHATFQGGFASMTQGWGGTLEQLATYLSEVRA